MKTRVTVCMAIAAAALVACDQVSVTAQWNPPLPLLLDESPTGIYRGTITDSSGSTPVAQPVTAIIDRDGHTQFLFAAAAERHVAGRVEVIGDRLTASLTEFSGTAANFTGADGADELTLQASVSTGSGIVGRYDAVTHAGRIALDYRVATDTPSSLALVTGVWSFATASSGGDLYASTWEVDDNGIIFGTDTLGCVFVGNVDFEDPLVNVYEISVQVTSCGYFDGDYSGLAFLSSAGGQDLNWLTLGMANDVFAYAAVFED